jgi:hypothetical protein
VGHPPLLGGKTFIQSFADYQGVITFGFNDETTYSTSRTGWNKRYIYNPWSDQYMVTLKTQNPPVSAVPTTPSK